MTKRLWMLAAVAAFLVVAKPVPDVRAAAAKLPMLKAETSDIVEVRKRGRGFRHFRGSRRHFRGHRRGFRHGYHRRRFHGHRRYRYRRWHRGPRIAIYRGYGRCGWLRRRAIITGSRYWWRRYRWCRGW